MVWNWTVRLALPGLLAILAALLHLIWEAPYKPGVLDVLGSAGIVIGMMGIIVWCVCAWLGCESKDPTSLPPTGH